MWRASSLSSTMRIRLRSRTWSSSSVLASRRTAGGQSGSFTVNRLPQPSPSLAASTWPPCSSTSWRTRVKPIPRPPRRRSGDRSSWKKRSKTRESTSGAMPTPVSAISKTPWSPRGWTRIVIRPPAGVYFGIAHEVGEDLIDAGRIGVDPGVLALHVDHEAVGAAGDLEGLQATRRALHQVDARPGQFDLSGGDPRGIQKVVDEVAEVAELALDDVTRPIRRIPSDHVEDADRGADRPEGVPELVCEHGEELLLAHVALLDLPVEEAVVEGEGSASAELLDHNDHRRVVGGARRLNHHREDADHRASREQRTDDPADRVLPAADLGDELSAQDAARPAHAVGQEGFQLA